jgi:hypothetical protein
MGFFGCDFCSLNCVKINSLVYGNGALFVQTKNAGMWKFGNEKKLYTVYCYYRAREFGDCVSFQKSLWPVYL